MLATVQKSMFVCNEAKIGLPVYWKADGVGILGTRTVGCGLLGVIAAGLVRTAMFY